MFNSLSLKKNKNQLSEAQEQQKSMNKITDAHMLLRLKNM